MASEIFADRKKCESVQEMIDNYMKIIPKPRLSKNKIIELQLDNFIQNNAKLINNRAPPTGAAKRLNNLLRSGTRSALSNKVQIKSQGNLNLKNFTSDLFPQITRRHAKPLMITSKIKQSPQLPIRKSYLPNTSSSLNLKNSKFGKTKIIIPSVSLDHNNLIKNQEKMLQVDMSKLSLEEWSYNF